MTSIRRDVVVAGASAGGVEALSRLVAGFPVDLPAAVLVVLHLPSGGTSALAKILDRAGPLPAVSARHGVPLERGKIYTAPPDHHLLLADDQLVLSHGPTENGHRPAIDALFRSSAISAGPRTMGVLLSGVLDDGVAGLRAISARGGRTLVQDPDDAAFAGMPRNAIRNVAVDHIATTSELGMIIDKLTRETVDPTWPSAPAKVIELENHIARYGGAVRAPGEFDVEELGAVSEFSCPDCRGTLIETEPGKGHFRCRVGHAWSARALLDAQGYALEQALWTALRVLDEKVSLAKRMGEQAAGRGAELVSNRYRRIAEEAANASAILRQHLDEMPPRPNDE
ncbi:chemotaxis protein CheB [Amycolatopsis anabasis]|uniref:chemotaxis protein CheB n=1 Tax=Amycolatopsis anabasis TaxID=1840409 RepID=UPI00131DF7F6|nr:chemotaxis protein CheB [Amycolatopsis anabasis]